MPTIKLDNRKLISQIIEWMVNRSVLPHDLWKLVFDYERTDQIIQLLKNKTHWAGLVYVRGTLHGIRRKDSLLENISSGEITDPYYPLCSKVYHSGWTDIGDSKTKKWRPDFLDWAGCSMPCSHDEEQKFEHDCHLYQVSKKGELIISVEDSRKREGLRVSHRYQIPSPSWCAVKKLRENSWCLFNGLFVYAYVDLDDQLVFQTCRLPEVEKSSKSSDKEYSAEYGENKLLTMEVQNQKIILLDEIPNKTKSIPYVLADILYARVLFGNNLWNISSLQDFDAWRTKNRATKTQQSPTPKSPTPKSLKPKPKKVNKQHNEKKPQSQLKRKLEPKQNVGKKKQKRKM